MTEQTISPEDIATLTEQLEQQSAKAALEKFRVSRQAQLDSAVIETSSGNKYDADEKSILRLTMAIIAGLTQTDDTITQWSLADTGTGVMSDVTLADLKEAQALAAQNMANIWSIT